MKLHPAVLAFALVLSAATPDLALAQNPPAAEAPSLRPEIAPPLQAAQKAINDKDFAAALQQLQQAEQVAGRTAFETYVLERLRFQAAAGLRDVAGVLGALEAMFATEQVEPELRAPLMDQASNAAYALKEYDKAISWANRAIDAGAKSDITWLRLAQVLHFRGRHQEAAGTLADLSARQVAAGQVQSVAQVKLRVSVYRSLKEESGYRSALEELIALEPKSGYWEERLALVMRQPGFDEALTIDLFRLSRHVGAFATAEADLEYADLALRAGFPAEAKAAIEVGYAAGRLGQGAHAGTHQALRDKATKAALADAAAGAPDAAALLARDPALALAAGWAQFTGGQRDAGLALMRQAVQKAPQPRLQVRLAEALRVAGDAPAARAALTAARDAATGDGASDLARLALLSLQGR